MHGIAEVRPFVEEGLVNALGGCCGSRPDHIAAIVKMASPCASAMQRWSITHLLH